MESRLPIRTCKNIPLQSHQDDTERQRILLLRKQRIISKLKLTKWLEDTNVLDGRLKQGLEMLTKNACAHAQSMEKPVHKEKSFVVNLKGPKFLDEMKARALERQIRSEKARNRRQTHEREKEALRFAVEEKERLLREEEKRQRIKEYWRKRGEEKDFEAKKELERTKILVQTELAKSMNRQRLLKRAMEKLKNIVNWKIQKENDANKMRLRIINKNNFVRWRIYTIRAVERRKNQLADKWCHFKMRERAFQAWEQIAVQSKMKQKKAEAHYNWCLKWTVLEQWRNLQQIIGLEKESEARREHWRSKICELMPDANDSFQTE